MNHDTDKRTAGPSWPQVILRVVVGIGVGALVGMIINSVFELSHFKSRLVSFSSVIIFVLLIFNYWMEFWELVVTFISDGIDNSNNTPVNPNSKQDDDS